MPQRVIYYPRYEHSEPNRERSRSPDTDGKGLCRESYSRYPVCVAPNRRIPLGEYLRQVGSQLQNGGSLCRFPTWHNCRVVGTDRAAGSTTCRSKELKQNEPIRLSERAWRGSCRYDPWN